MNNGMPPFVYEETNLFSGTIQPSNVHVTNTNLSRYYQKYLFQKALSVFQWDIPATWDMNYFLFVLYYTGYVGIINTDKYGVIPQFCGLKGYDIYYQPSHIVIQNPLIRKTLEPRIGVNCEIIKLQPTWTGIWDIVSYYADCMALVSESFAVNALNSKMPFLFTAGDSNIAQSIRKMYDKIASGDPAIVIDKKLFDGQTGSVEVKPINGPKADELYDMLDVMEKLEYHYNMLVGIPTNIYYTHVRNVQVQSHIMESRSLAEMWYEQLQEGVKRTNDMFGLNISVDWRTSIYESVPDNDGAIPKPGSRYDEIFQSTSFNR